MQLSNLIDSPLEENPATVKPIAKKSEPILEKKSDKEMKKSVQRCPGHGAGALQDEVLSSSLEHLRDKYPEIYKRMINWD